MNSIPYTHYTTLKHSRTENQTGIYHITKGVYDEPPTVPLNKKNTQAKIVPVCN